MISLMELTNQVLQLASKQELQKQCKNCYKNMSTEAHTESFVAPDRSKIEWNDRILEKIACSKKFPKEVFDKENFKPILSRFFYFYFTGKVTEGCSVSCTTYSTISLLNVVDEKGYRRVFVARDYLNIGDARPFYKGSHDHQQLSYFEHYEKNNHFRNDIMEMLKKWDIQNVWNKQQAKLMRFAAFLALTFCTVAIKNTKTKQQLEMRFKNKDFRTNLSYLVGWNMQRLFSIPCAEAMDKCIEELPNEIHRRSLKSLFAIVVREWRVRVHRDDEIISSLLFESLLESTAGNGLGFLSLMTSVLYTMDITFDDLINALRTEELSFGEHRASWTNLLEFKDKFLCKENPQYGYPWARLIDSVYLTQYAAPNNVFFCGMFAAIIEIYSGPGVWNARWAQVDRAFLSDAKIVGKRIHDYLIRRKKR